MSARAWALWVAVLGGALGCQATPDAVSSDAEVGDAGDSGGAVAFGDAYGSALGDAVAVEDLGTPDDLVAAGDLDAPLDVAPEPDLVAPNDAGPMGDVTPEDVDGGSLPAAPALARLLPADVTVPFGTTVDVPWSAAGATACVLTANGVSVAEGTSGVAPITVSGLTHLVLRCDPPGPGAVAAIGLAPECETVTSLVGAASLFDGSFTLDSVPVDTTTPGCFDIDGTLMSAHGDPAIAARIRRVSGNVFFFHGGSNGLDYVALEHAGSFTLDYQNGAFSPGVDGVEGEYVSFPSLTSLDVPLILLHAGRGDVRALAGAVLTLGAMDAVDLPEGEPLGGVTLSYTALAVPPRLTGAGGGVSGDVSVHHNALLPHALAEAWVASLGPVAGTVTICSNLDDAPCPEP